jgi:putative transposase
MYVPGMPYHIVQRGNNREPCFLEPENYQFYLELWQTISLRYGVAVHAYCLMTNHVHSLATPEYSTSISNTMKVVGSRYAQYINCKYQRTGTLWEGRHRSSLVQSERYLLVCYRYIELNPVRAGMVKQPEEYQWSSYGTNGWGDRSWLTPHQEYRRLGRGPNQRCASYRELFTNHVSDQDLSLIRKASHFCQPVSDDRFRILIEEKYGLRSGYMKHGRPRRVAEGVIKK